MRRTKLIKSYYKAGAQVNTFKTIEGLEYARGLSPFYIAILTGSYELVQFLIQQGAQPAKANKSRLYSDYGSPTYGSS